MGWAMGTLAALPVHASLASGQPVFIGLDEAYSIKTNTAPLAIERGVRAAMEEINAKGGVLGGRPLQLITTDHQGLAMALFSQCFALSSFAAPLLAGWFLDHHHHGLWLWLATALACLLGLPLVAQIGRYQQQQRLLSGLNPARGAP